MRREVPSTLYLCRVALKRVRSSTNNQAKRGRSLRGRWKTKRRLNHSRLRLAVIVVVRLVGCVCVVLIVALEREREGGKEKRSEVQREVCSWIMNVKVSLKYPCCAKADTLHSCQSNRIGQILCWQRSCSKVNKPAQGGVFVRGQI